MVKDKKFVLWGHGLSDYKEMFSLSDEDLKGPILEVGAGASSLNAELTRQGVEVVSCDELYGQAEDVLKTEVNETFSATLASIKDNQSAFNLRPFGDLQQLEKDREKRVELFLNDVSQGKKAGRYQRLQQLPLPFENYQFNLALVCHHLFVNHEEQTLEEHLNLIRELIRVAGEVRIFPLIDKYGQTSNLLGPVLLALQQEDEVASEVKEVPSQIQPTGNAMLRVWTLKCEMES